MTAQLVAYAADFNAVSGLLVGLLGGAAVALVNGLLLRPKTSAEAKQTNVTAEVSLSADSRQWVDQAMGRAQKAEERVDVLEGEVDGLRSVTFDLIDYIRLLWREWGSTDRPPPPPPNLEARLRSGAHRAMPPSEPPPPTPAG